MQHMQNLENPLLRWDRMQVQGWVADLQVDVIVVDGKVRVLRMWPEVQARHDVEQQRGRLARRVADPHVPERHRRPQQIHLQRYTALNKAPHEADRDDVTRDDIVRQPCAIFKNLLKLRV